MKHTTKNIFLDTNVFEENNFFHSSNIQSLFYYSRIGIIKLFMTSVSKMELLSRIKKHLIETKEDHNKLIRSLNKQKSRIIRNLDKYSNLELSPIKVEESLSELTKKLNTIIATAKINIISADSVNIEEVFSLFYDEKPPFSSNEKKRYEFPDAFIVKSIDTWCIANKKKMIFISKDNDFNDYKSKHLFFRNDLVEILESITNYFDSIQSNQIIPNINESLIRNRNLILNLIESELRPKILLEADYENTTPIQLSKPQYHSSKITSIRPDYAEVTYYVELTYKFSIFPSSIDLGRSIFEDNLNPKNISDKIVIPCDLEISLTRRNNINLKWVNSNQKIRINVE